MSRGAALAAALGLLVVAASVGVLLYVLRDPGDSMVATGSGTAPTAVAAVPPSSDIEAEPTAGPVAPPAPIQPAPVEPTATPVPEFVSSAVFDGAVVQAAVQQGLANPSQALPARDVIVTEVLNAQLRAGGHDLTGMAITVYPPGPIPSFVLVETTDDTALIATDVASDTSDAPTGELFLTDLITASALADFGVETFVMQHTGVDDVGPYVLTLTVAISDLQGALASGGSAFDDLNAQLERPS